MLTGILPMTVAIKTPIEIMKNVISLQVLIFSMNFVFKSLTISFKRTQHTPLY